ncbi:MAG TPA: Calx-beta domain-containing protein, partial [Pyrinomonadaceae bacterium]|nr:Calx-beta domain-containing protein [Pyrinomonadaceae bacterium]
NVIAGALSSIYPANNYFPSSLTSVLDSAYHVVNPAYKSAGTDGKDLGCDINALNVAQSSGSSNPTPTPTPTPTPIPTPTPTPSPTPNPTPTPAGSIQFSAASYGVNEGAGSITITVTRSGNTSASASVQFTTANGSASSDGDYVIATGTLVFAPGQSSRSFAVSIIDDTVKESTETFNVILSNVSNATSGGPSTATISVVDNDKRPKGRVSIPRVGAPRAPKAFIREISDARVFKQARRSRVARYVDDLLLRDLNFAPNPIRPDPRSITVIGSGTS